MIIYNSDISIAADRFDIPADYYFLSHFHFDHMSGMKKWDRTKKIFCSSLTSKLIQYEFKLPENRIQTVIPDEIIYIDDIKITSIDANHCPGSLMFLLETSDQKILYTGDFRLNDNIKKYYNIFSEPDIMYCDKTFDNGNHKFPTQEEAISEIIELIRKNPDKNIIVAIYNMGKNKILQAINKTLNKKIYISAKKAKYYDIIGMSDVITTKKSETNIFGYSRFYLEEYYRQKENDFIIVPTGLGIKPHYKNMYPHFNFVLYSEHSSPSELKDFISNVKPKTIKRIHK